MAGEGMVDKAKFDALLAHLINSKPATYKDVVAEPKRTKGGDVKRSKKRKTRKSPA